MLKKSLVFIVLAVLLLASSLSMAQENSIPVFCGNLSEADCQLLTAAQQTSGTLESATFAIDGGLTINHIPEAPFDSLTFTLDGEGSYAADAGMMQSIVEMQSNMAEMFSNPEQIGALYENLLNGIEGDVTLTLTLPTELQSFGSPSNPVPESLSIGLRLVDGVGYVNLSPLAEQLPQADIPAGWYGFEIAKFSGLAFDRLFAEMGDELQELDFGAYSQFSNPEFLNKYMTVERAADEAGLAVFVMSFDYAGLLTGPEFRDMLEGQMQAAGEPVDEAEFDQIMGMLTQMYEGIEMTITTRVGLEDQFIHNASFSFTWDMTALMNFMTLSGTESGLSDAPVLEFNVGITYDNFNAAPAIEAPDAVEIFKAEDAMRSLGGLSDL